MEINKFMQVCARLIWRFQGPPAGTPKSYVQKVKFYPDTFLPPSLGAQMGHRTFKLLLVAIPPSHLLAQFRAAEAGGAQLRHPEDLGDPLQTLETADNRGAPCAARLPLRKQYK